MQVHAHELVVPNLSSDQFDKALELGRVGVACGVRQPDFIAATFHKLYSNLNNLLLIYFTF